MVKKLIIALAIILLIGTAGWNVYQVYFVPKTCFRPMIYYDNSLFWDVNVVARKNDDTGLRLEYIGTVDSIVPETEKPDSEFECNSKVFLDAKLYRDGNGAYYLRCKNGNLLLLVRQNADFSPASDNFFTLIY